MCLSYHFLAFQVELEVKLTEWDKQTLSSFTTDCAFRFISVSDVYTLLVVLILQYRLPDMFPVFIFIYGVLFGLDFFCRPSLSFRKMRRQSSLLMHYDYCEIRYIHA